MEELIIRFFDMFAGIGGFRAGLTRAGGYECIGHCEIDKHADAAYRSVHNVKESEVFYEDATKINTDTLPQFDPLCAGFPCQAFSIAGRRQGFLDPRGTLFFEIARVARARRPAYLLLENVPGLLSHDKGRTFAAILHELCDMGYRIEWQVLNARILESLSPDAGYTLSDILIKNAPEKYYLSETQTKRLLYSS